MHRLEGGVVVVVVGEPEPDVVRPQVVGVLDKGRLSGKVLVQLLGQDHLVQLVLAIHVRLLVPVIGKLQSERKLKKNSKIKNSIFKSKIHLVENILVKKFTLKNIRPTRGFRQF